MRGREQMKTLALKVVVLGVSERLLTVSWSSRPLCRCVFVVTDEDGCI